jgi:LPXTG-site transpeptidase (sortase) family protein
VVRFQANVLSVPVQGGITNISTVTWTSLPDDPSQLSQYNVLSTERTYDPGVSSSVTLNALTQATLPATGFAPGVVTNINKLPQTIYSQKDDLTLEIPTLKVELPIVGVPLQNGIWDLTWLWNQAGWLQGSAYPTYDGNSVLTAHIYLPNGQPGPFVNLAKLSWGQEVAIVSNGLRYVFQVREVGKVNPNDMTVFRHEEKPWLTLLTCKEYDENTNSYRSRLVVRAVLVRVENPPE